MFGITIPPGVDQVRIIALNGKKGKPPCLWEGIPSVEQARIEECIGSDRRLIQWLQRNGMIDNGVPFGDKFNSNLLRVPHVFPSSSIWPACRRRLVTPALATARTGLSRQLQHSSRSRRG